MNASKSITPNVHKPIIGIIGGIGSGKSFVASLFGELGAMVIRSDDLVHEVYRRPEVLQTLRDWWGSDVITAEGTLDRRAVASRVFTDDAQRKRLEALVHPLVDEERKKRVAVGENDPQVKAFVWDTPLLAETGLHARCDAVVFVDAPLATRIKRVEARGWSPAELERREKLQMSLDKKQRISQYVVVNSADAEAARSQVRQVFPRILKAPE